MTTAIDVAVRHPRTLAHDADVRAVRAQLSSDHVHLVLLVDGDRLVGTVRREDLSPDHPDDVPAASVARLDGRTVAPSLDEAALRDVLRSRRTSRAAVVAADGTLLGLVCLNRHGRFCTDAGIAARAEERRALESAR